ncbi:large ribosomal subunit protein P2 isoform X3 [Manis javanica]|uniref:large ribosomal subunit protein P2 isoform X3 n=1 Tax=Manis javanica TaxID=9974 RepID=UPI003C6CEE62
MRYVASYLLAALGGNASPSAKDIKKILDSVGIEADDDRLNKVLANWPACQLAGLWLSLLPQDLQPLLPLPPQLQQRRRRTRRRRSLRSQMTTWDLAYSIRAPLQIKQFCVC